MILGEIYVRPNSFKVEVQHNCKACQESTEIGEVTTSTVAVARICFQISFIQHHFNVKLEIKNHQTNPN